MSVVFWIFHNGLSAYKPPVAISISGIADGIKILQKGCSNKAAISPLAILSPAWTGESIITSEDQQWEEEDLQVFKFRVHQRSYSNYRHVCECLILPQASRKMLAIC